MEKYQFENTILSFLEISFKASTTADMKRVGRCDEIEL